MFLGDYLIWVLPFRAWEALQGSEWRFEDELAISTLNGGYWRR
jgi:hypothetical protein